MSKLSAFRTAGVMSLAIVAGVALVAAQDVAPRSQQPTPIPSGTYEKFTVIQKIRLGATTLVNPSAAESAAVVYSYDPTQFVATAGWTKEVSDKISAGEVQFGQIVKSGTNTRLRVDQKRTNEIANTIQQRDPNDSASSQKGKFLSIHPSLAGAKPSGEWITWLPEDKKE